MMGRCGDEGKGKGRESRKEGKGSGSGRRKDGKGKGKKEEWKDMEKGGKEGRERNWLKEEKDLKWNRKKRK